MKITKILVTNLILCQIFIGCEWIYGGTGIECYGHWVKGPGHQRGTRHMLKDASLPYYQCFDENPPHNDVQGKRRYL